MYGFDTKYAMHMLRLGFQRVELLTTGRLSLPMREPERSFLLDVRRGKISEEECLTRASALSASSPTWRQRVHCRANRTKHPWKRG